MTRARHIHTHCLPHRPREEEDGGTAGAELNFNHGVAVTHRFYSFGWGTCATSVTSRLHDTRDTQKVGKQCPKWHLGITPRAASFKALNSAGHCLVMRFNSDNECSNVRRSTACNVLLLRIAVGRFRLGSIVVDRNLIENDRSAFHWQNARRLHAPLGS